MNRKARRMFAAMNKKKGSPVLPPNEMPNTTGYSEYARVGLPLDKSGVKLRACRPAIANRLHKKETEL